MSLFPSFFTGKCINFKSALLSAFLAGGIAGTSGAAFSANVADDASGSVLSQIRNRGEFIIGHHVQNLIPFAFVDANNRPQGYSIDVCNAIYENVKTALQMPNLKLTYKRVQGKDRMNDPKNGVVDVECGTTTITKARLQEINFSYAFFVAGARFMVNKNSGIKNVDDLKNKRVAVSARTTTVKIVQDYSDRKNLGIRLVEAQNLDGAFDLLEKGQADAFVTEDAALWGLSQKSKNPQDYIFVGDYLSQEPYGIGYKKGDAPFGKIIDLTVADFARSGRAKKSFDKWFGINPENGLNSKTEFPMSYLLKDALRRPSKIPAF